MIGFDNLLGQTGLIVVLFAICVWAVVAVSRYDILDSEISPFEEDIRHLTNLRAQKISALAFEHDLRGIAVHDDTDMYSIDDANVEMNERQEELLAKGVLSEAQMDDIADIKRDLKRASKFYNHIAKRYNDSLMRTPDYVLSGDRVQKPYLHAFA